MKERRVLPLLLSMSVPMVISMLVNSLYNIVDSIFAAKISENAMTALSLVFPVQNLINSIAVGFGVGISAVIAICLGAGKQRQADTAASQGMLFAVLHGVILTAAWLLGMQHFLKMFTEDGDIIREGWNYSSIVISFSVVIMAGITFEKIFQSVGKMKITMIGMICGCVVNIILDPIMIFGMGPVPALGIRGAAWATGDRADGHPGDLCGCLRCKTTERETGDEESGMGSYHLYEVYAVGGTGGHEHGASVTAGLGAEWNSVSFFPRHMSLCSAFTINSRHFFICLRMGSYRV